MISKELVAASTIPIVLSLLKEKDNYGYQLIKDVQRISGGSLQWKEGSLYPVLLKLEKKGLISSYIKQENGRNRKY
ncbi:MAG: PadR family transcriptional regulator, partial [Bacteroidota bacterium]